jgi:phage protein D
VVLDGPTLEARTHGRLPGFGQALTLSMGSADDGVASRSLFQGRIVGLGRRRDQGSAPRIEVEATDALQSLAMTRRSRVFPEGTAADVIREVAAGHRLTAEVARSFALPGLIAQADETDLALLRRLARQTDGDFWVEGTTLHFGPFGHGDGETVTLSADTDLLEYRIHADLSGQRAEVEVRGWDPRMKDSIAERPGPGNAGVAPGSLGSGPQVLGESWSRGLPPSESSVHLGPSTPQEARNWATAWSRSLERGFVELRGTVGPASPWIRPRLPLELTDVGSPFQGRYQVVACRYLMNPREGFRTEFRALRWVRHRRGISHE